MSFSLSHESTVYSEENGIFTHRHPPGKFRAKGEQEVKENSKLTGQFERVSLSGKQAQERFHTLERGYLVGGGCLVTFGHHVGPGWHAIWPSSLEIL